MDVDSVEDLMKDVDVKSCVLFYTGEKKLKVSLRCAAVPAKYSDILRVLPQLYMMISTIHEETSEEEIVEHCKKRIRHCLEERTLKIAFAKPIEEERSQEVADEMNKEYASVAEGASPMDGRWVIPISGYIRRPRPSDYDMAISGLGSFPLAV